MNQHKNLTWGLILCISDVTSEAPPHPDYNFPTSYSSFFLKKESFDNFNENRMNIEDEVS